MRVQTNTVPSRVRATGQVCFPLWNRPIWWHGEWRVGGLVVKMDRPRQGAVVQQ